MSDVLSSDTSKTTTDRVEHLPGWLIALGLGLGLGYGGFVVLLWRLGLFDVPTDGPDAEIFAAVFALLGGLFGAVLTFVAALLKHTIDTRTLELSRQTEARLAQEHSQSEARLKLDTAIRAVELLATSDGSPSPPTKQAGSLFALTSLGQIDLALALLAETWSDDEVSTDAAMWIVDRGLRDDRRSVQIDSARIFRENATKLTTPGSGTPFIPALLEEEWPTSLPEAARFYLLDALISALASSDPAGYKLTEAYGIFGFLSGIQAREEEPALKSGVLRTMEVLANTVEPSWLDEIRDQLEAEPPGPTEGQYLYDSVTTLRSRWASP